MFWLLVCRGGSAPFAETHPEKGQEQIDHERIHDRAAERKADAQRVDPVTAVVHDLGRNQGRTLVLGDPGQAPAETNAAMHVKELCNFISFEECGPDQYPEAHTCKE